MVNGYNVNNTCFKRNFNQYKSLDVIYYYYYYVYLIVDEKLCINPWCFLYFRY